MPPILTIKKISLNQVNFNDFTYSVDPMPGNLIDETLKRSIERYGIIHPPVLKEMTSGLYTVVTGRKRLNGLLSLQVKETYCLIVPPEFPETELYHLLLEEAQLTRPFTITEKAIFLQKLMPLTEEYGVIKNIMPRLGFAPDPFTLKQTIELLNLESQILLGLHRGEIAEAIAQDFLSLSVQDRLILFEIITSLKLSFSNQKKLLFISRELANRENIKLTEIFTDPEVTAILHHQDTNPPQKTKKLMTWLSQKHRPRFTEAEDEFNRFIAEIRLPRNVSVTHTPFFEDDKVALTISFKNRKFLQNAWGKIKHDASESEN